MQYWFHMLIFFPAIKKKGELQFHLSDMNHDHRSPNTYIDLFGFCLDHAHKAISKRHKIFSQQPYRDWMGLYLPAK